MKRFWRKATSIFLSLTLLMCILPAASAVALEEGTRSGGTFIKISAKGDHTLALKDDGTVWAWGSNEWGQCGTGSVSDQVMLTKVSGLADIVDISAGYEHSMALDANGNVYTWGRNNYGQLGIGYYLPPYSAVPNLVYQGASPNAQIEAGSEVSYLINPVSYNWMVYGWGSTSSGMLGPDMSNSMLTSPTYLGSSFDGLQQISAGRNHCVGLRYGYIVTWGYNHYGVLGVGNFTSTRTQPEMVYGLPTPIGSANVFASYPSSFVIDSDGSLWGWGTHGLGENTNSPTPILLEDHIPLRQIATGDWFALALKQDGTVLSFGSNYNGQLGLGDLDNRTEMTPVNKLTNIVQVAVGTSHSVALDENGQIWVWGANSNGQLGNGTAINSSTPVKLQASYALDQEGLTISGKLADSSTVYEYQFTPTQTGVYTFTTAGLTDTSAVLYDSYGDVIVENDNIAATFYELNHVVTYPISNYNFRISDHLSMGKTYVLKIKSGGGGSTSENTYTASGDYTLKVSYAPEKLRLSGNELFYTPSEWNTATTYKKNNCYNYALNYQSGTFLQPGQLANKNNFNPIDYADPDKDALIHENDTSKTYEVRDYTKMIEAFTDLCKADALASGGVFQELEENDQAPEGCYKVALVFSPLKYYYTQYNKDNKYSWNLNWDYHWYRLNRDGTWSHKPGRSLVRDTDFLDQKIYNPSPDGNYTYNYQVFAGYYAVKDLSHLASVNALTQSPSLEPEQVLPQTREQYPLNAFDFLEAGMQEASVKAVLGEPNEQIGSGILRDVYYLDDGRQVVLDYGMYRDGLSQAYITDNGQGFGDSISLLY